MVDDLRQIWSWTRRQCSLASSTGSIAISSRCTDLYEQRLQCLEYADEAGFYCYHLAEHQATPLGMAPSPGVFLSAAIQRTQRLRLGPLVYLLPLYNPLRLVQEICMLDKMSRGRLEVGIGRGVSPYELAFYNVTPPAGARHVPGGAGHPRHGLDQRRGLVCRRVLLVPDTCVCTSNPSSVPIRPSGIRPTTPTRSPGWPRRDSTPSRTIRP